MVSRSAAVLGCDVHGPGRDPSVRPQRTSETNEGAGPVQRHELALILANPGRRYWAHCPFPHVSTSLKRGRSEKVRQRRCLMTFFFVTAFLFHFLKFR